MTGKLSGTCINGPWAGRYYVSSSSPHIKVPIYAEPMRLTEESSGEPFSVSDSFRTGYYHFVKGFRNGDGRQMNFFVFEDHSTDCMDILETILDGYWKYMQACK